jgi:hypothetical protein
MTVAALCCVVAVFCFALCLNSAWDAIDPGALAGATAVKAGRIRHNS